MTTFQDPQPQSRRAMRANERGEAVEPTPAAEQPAPFIEPVPLVEPEVRAPQFTSSVPSFDPEQFRRRADARESVPSDATQALPQVEQPSYRPRDFSQQPTAAPEPSPFVTAPPASEPVAAAVAPAAEPVHAVDAPASEHTLTRRELRALRESGADVSAQTPVQEAPVQQAPVAEPVALEQPPVTAAPVSASAGSANFDFSSLFEQPAETEAPVVPEPVATVDETPVTSSEPQAWPFGTPLTPTAEQAPAVVEAEIVPEAPAAEAVAEEPAAKPFSFLRRSKRAAKETEPEDAVVEPEAVSELFAPVAEPVVEQVLPVAEPVAEQPQRLFEPAPTTSIQAETPAVTPFDALFTPKSSTDASPATQAWTAPVGHWSTQADLDDESQPHENTINRSVGTGSTATNALVLPSIPAGSDIRGPLTENGQITLTGSIDLSHSLGSTGNNDRLENTGIDALFELHDAEAVSTDSAPVRAIRAVSTHNTGHGVTHTQKPKGNRALTGLLIAASSMAVVVAGLLVAALAFNLF